MVGRYELVELLRRTEIREVLQGSGGAGGLLFLL